MNEFLTELKALFVNASQYTSVFGTVLNANFAREGAEFPLAVYTMNPVEKVSKDGEMFSVEVSFYFAIEQFPQCVDFYDTIKTVIEASDFMSEIFTPVTDYDLDLNKIIVNLKKIK
jgi:hypothetical protein